MTDEQSMVERVSRVLCRRAGGDPDSTRGGYLDDYHYASEGIPGWTMFADDARAVIEAMREPTDHMIQAGSRIDFGINRDSGDFCFGHPAEVWPEMINAALAETK